MKIKSIYMPFILAIVFLVGIYGSSALGFWSAEEVKELTKIVSGEFEGMPDPEDIRGSYSFGDLYDAFDIDPLIMAKAFGIESDDPAAIKAKDLELFYPDLPDDTEIGTGAIKIFVSIYTGLPYVGEDDLPRSAVDVLMSDGKWSDELTIAYEGRIIELPSAEIVTVEVQEEKAESEAIAEEDHEEVVVGEIKGKTTVTDLLDWGLTIEQVEVIFGFEVANNNMVIRDICNDNGLSFGDVKVEILALLP